MENQSHDNADSTMSAEVASQNVAAEKPSSDKITDNLKSLGEYNRELIKELPKDIFKREPTRVKYMVMFLTIVAASVYALINFDLPIIAKLAISVFMGIALGGNAFIAHEILHGAIIKNRKVQDALGFIGFASFLISPTYWRFWHNNLHHGNTQLLYKDPDAFPTMMVWKKSKFMQRVFKLAPGSGFIRSYFYFFYWFSFQAVLNQVYMRFGNKMWDRMNHKKVTLEFALQAALVVGFINFVGPANWLWLVIIPFAVQNYTVMSYISTNHNISPYTKVNDPLVNSVTVTNNPIMEFLNLNFGYHTEHHLFASMPMSKAKKVSAKLKELYPDRYQIMPKSKALSLLYKTPRIYKNRETLVNPYSGKEYKTLGLGLEKEMN